MKRTPQQNYDHIVTQVTVYAGLCANMTVQEIAVLEGLSEDVVRQYARQMPRWWNGEMTRGTMRVRDKDQEKSIKPPHRKKTLEKINRIRELLVRGKTSAQIAETIRCSRGEARRWIGQIRKQERQR